eukprot:TRINITY_DN34018_c0_g1_i1.p1 TRINITY_DN34018_c0_g1~~TRINITY_DN34018_c0_g1_i1.p1  ORF type:complete len:394 (+),score=61.92 TRINITY_DN34018_c0_g1_i1:100-1281(+)
MYLHGALRAVAVVVAAAMTAVNGLGHETRYADVTVYNPLAANRHDRLEDICNEIRGAVIVVVGTRWRAWDDTTGYAVKNVAGYHAVQFGYARGQNKHAGITILLSKAVYRKDNVTKIITPKDNLLKGRVAGVRLKTPKSDMTVIGAYYPPPYTRQTKKVWHAVNDKVSEWISQVPGRSIPIVCCDANCHVGSVNTEDDDMSPVGVYDKENEDECGGHLREMLQSHEMSLYNTHYKCGKTFFSATGSGRSTRVDYIAGPQSLLQEQRVLRCRVRLYAGDRLQIIKCCKRADHRPVTARLAIELTYHKKTDETRWNWDALVEAAVHGSEDGNRFRGEVDRRLAEAEDEWLVLERQSSTVQWEHISTICHDVCRSIFATKKRDAEVCAKHRFELRG